jgi:hypothetical protein
MKKRVANKKKTHDTLQFNISPREIITELTSQNRKVLTLKSMITTSWANFTLALFQVIKNLEGRANPISRVVLDPRVAMEGRVNMEFKA